MMQSSEGQLFIEDSRVVKRDIVTLNGVIHIIEAPLRSLKGIFNRINLVIINTKAFISQDSVGHFER